MDTLQLLLMPSISIWPFPYSISLSLSLFCKIGATYYYMQNCTYHKVLLSAANKPLLMSVSNEMHSPLNELSIGCIGLQHGWKREDLFLAGFFHGAGQLQPQNHLASNHDVENLRRIEFVLEKWHSTSLYHPLTGQGAAGRFPNIP